MDPVIKIRIEQHYGRAFYYPDGELAKGLCELLGQTSLTVGNLRKLQRIGFAIKIGKNDKLCQELIRQLLERESV